MRSINRWVLFLSLGGGAVAAGLLLAPGSSPGPDERTAVDSAASGTRVVSPPLIFEENAGQAEEETRFLGRARGYLAKFRPDGVLLAAEGGAADDARIALAEANANPSIRGEERLTGVSHYFQGDDPAQWRTHIPHYANVVYEEVYPGIDWVWYGDGSRLEYDFRVAPGADASQARLAFDPRDRLRVEPNGDLLVQSGEQETRYLRPVVYQEIDEQRETVSGDYALLAENRVGFELGSYDSTRELVIDPVLAYSSYFGIPVDEGNPSVVVDDAGNAFVSGRGGGDVVVFKMLPDASAVEYIVQLGGSGQERSGCRGSALAIDEAGNAYLTGETTSSNFPVTPGAFDEQSNGDDDVFVVKLDPAGVLTYATYLGGSGEDDDACVALGPEGDVYVVSETDSTDFPTTPGAYDESFNDQVDVTVSRLRLAGQGAADLLYSTYVGGSCNDRDPSVVVDETGAAFVVAETGLPPDFPTTPGAFDTSHNGEIDLVVFKIDPAGRGAQDLAYSTFFGGSGTDNRSASGKGIALDVRGDVYVIGENDSENVPLPITPGAYDSTFNGEDDIFIAKLRFGSQGVNDLIFSTLIGGSGLDESTGIFVDEAGLVYFSGDTDSELRPFPTVNPLQPRFAGGFSDVVFGVLSPDGGELLFSTYFGGSGFDCCPDLFVDSSGRLTVVGVTDSANFPTTPGVFDTTLAPGGDDDLFVSRVSELGVRMFTVSNASGSRPELAPETIVSGFGINLADQTIAATAQPLPTILAGVTVRVIDSAGVARSAPLFFVSALQINYLIPAGTATGWAQVEVVRNGQIVSRDGILVTDVSPGIFTANSTGSGAPLATFLRANGDGSRSDGLVYDAGAPVGQRQPVALDLGGQGDQFFLILFGTGLRGATTVTVTIDGVAVPFAGPVGLPQFVGLDQINLGPLPLSLAGRGEVDVVLTLNGVEANVVRIRIG